MTQNTWIGIVVAAFFVLLFVGSLVADHYGLLLSSEELHEQDEERWKKMRENHDY